MKRYNQSHRMPAKGKRFALLMSLAAAALVGAASGFGDDKPVFQGIADRIRYRESFNHPFIDDTYSPAFWGQLARHTHYPVTQSPAAPLIMFGPAVTIKDWELWRATGVYPPGLASGTFDHSPAAPGL